MDIRVSGHQVDTGDALRTHVEDRLQGVADKYFSRSISAHVTFGNAPHSAFSCDIVAHVMQGVILKGSGQGTEAHPAFDVAADRIETQLRRYMRRLKNKHGTNGVASAEPGEIADDAGYTVFQAAEEESAGEHPPIVAELRVDVPEASVGDAVMMLDLRNTNALLFKNSGTGAFNMVYRRGDGTIGWVEPQRAA
ncbi:ribosome-associated translation inhibitor RaiA [Sphingomonas sp.]|uniref:ribosome hibernation-promoting factor, HPF/YfiA family n=1 Tax=Sphingomonas sp. TaxID=28214 RepID=UPI000DB7E45E|nr:ribosome-associated translation inhibitor RaiA [Sphingomonas sp.]PZU11916.1 MAG: ribosome-associated translation inhibitor RaiA [Sphingomonas sp.]